MTSPFDIITYFITRKYIFTVTQSNLFTIIFVSYSLEKTRKKTQTNLHYFCFLLTFNSVNYYCLLLNVSVCSKREIFVYKLVRVRGLLTSLVIWLNGSKYKNIIDQRLYVSNVIQMIQEIITSIPCLLQCALQLCTLIAIIIKVHHYT